jgi:hypothetical protein
MSVAICLACGAFKSNAFLPCLGCGIRPRGLDALARQLLVTDISSTTPSTAMRELAEKVKRAVATNQPIVFDPKASRPYGRRSRGSCKEAIDPPIEYPLADDVIRPLAATLTREPLLRNVGGAVPAARQGTWVALPGWADALERAASPARQARFPGPLDRLYADAKKQGGEALARYERAMGRAAPFSQEVISSAAFGSLRPDEVDLVAKFVQMDVVACFVLLEHSVATADARTVLGVYTDGHFFAGWVDGTERLQVY